MTISHVITAVVGVSLLSSAVNAQTQPPSPSPLPAAPTSAPETAPGEATNAEEEAGNDFVRRSDVQAMIDAEVAKLRGGDPSGGAPGQPATEPPAVRGQSGFGDVRLALTMTNENVLASPGESLPSVPGWRFGRPNSLAITPLDGYDSRYSGYETTSHAVLYRNFRRGRLEVDSALALRINEVSERTIDFSDAGSYILVSLWKDPAHEAADRVTLTAFPMSSDRMRLGYSYRLSWGGNETYRRSKRAIPGLKLQLDTDRGYAFAAVKTAIVLDPATAEEEAVFGWMGGSGVDLTKNLRVEVNGGYFDRGKNELLDVRSQSVRLYGASAQVSVYDGAPLQSSTDYRLFKNDPERMAQLLKKPKYPGGVSWAAMAEGTVLGQTLKDPDATGGTTVQVGTAADLNLRLMINRLRLRLDLQYRDVAYLLHTAPSLPTFSDFPREFRLRPNLLGAVGADNNWGDWLTIGAIVGLERPASLETPMGIPGDTSGVGAATTVVRSTGQMTVLPPGEAALPQLIGKFSAQADFGQHYAAIFDVYGGYDGNQTRLQRMNPVAPLEYEFGNFVQLGFNLTLQAKF